MSVNSVKITKLIDVQITDVILAISIAFGIHLIVPNDVHIHFEDTGKSFIIPAGSDKNDAERILQSL
jgi:hypothetical protein